MSRPRVIIVATWAVSNHLHAGSCDIDSSIARFSLLNRVIGFCELPRLRDFGFLCASGVGMASYHKSCFDFSLIWFRLDLKQFDLTYWISAFFRLFFKVEQHSGARSLGFNLYATSECLSWISLLRRQKNLGLSLRWGSSTFNPPEYARFAVKFREVSSKQIQKSNGHRLIDLILIW